MIDLNTDVLHENAIVYIQGVDDGSGSPIPFFVDKIKCRRSVSKKVRGFLHRTKYQGIQKVNLIPVSTDYAKRYQNNSCKDSAEQSEGSTN